jgi:hypothetical protein
MARHHDLRLEANAQGQDDKKGASHWVLSLDIQESSGGPAAGRARSHKPVWWSLVMDGEEALLPETGAGPYRLLLRMIS